MYVLVCMMYSCIIQEIVLNGVGHTKTFQLEVVKSKSGDKSVNVTTLLGTHSYGPFSTFPNDNNDVIDDSFLGKLTKSFPFARLGSQFASSGVHLPPEVTSYKAYPPFWNRRTKDGGFCWSKILECTVLTSI